MNSLLPSGHSSVMSGRQVTAPGDLDYFPTPPWAGRAGGELITRLDPAAISCWEPACGEGHLAHGLADYFPRPVGCSDVHGYGRGAVYDFLAPGDPPPDVAASWDWIATNPPFKDAEAFIRRALPRARRGVAMLLRSVFRESAGRHRMFSERPCTVVAQFAERVPMVKGRWDPEASSATAYAWFIWLKSATNSPLLTLAEQARALAGDPTAAIDLLIPPGARTRLHRAGDVAKFCGVAGAPLFEETQEEK